MHSNVLRSISRLVALVIVLTGTQAWSAEAPDEFTRKVAKYELTLPNLEAYGKVMSGIAEWAKAKPAKVAALLKRAPQGPTTLKQSIAHMESEPAIAEVLNKNKLAGRDFVLIPMVVMQARIAVLGEAQGRAFPSDRINPKNTALVRAHEAQLNDIMSKATTDRVRAFGR